MNLSNIFYKKCKKSIDLFFTHMDIITMLRLTETQHELMRIGVMAAQQTLTLLVEVRVLYP